MHFRIPNRANLNPTPLKKLSQKLHNLVDNRLWLQVLIAMLLGTFLGLLLGPASGLVNQTTSLIIGEWLALPGTLFIRIIQMIVIPLIFASIISGIAASESMQQLKKTGIFIAFYFVITTSIAITIGILLAFWIQPGNYVQQTNLEAPISEPSPSNGELPSWQELPSVIGAVLPSNVFGSAINGEMLQIVIFSIIFGVALVNLSQSQAKPLLDLIASTQSVCMTIVKWAMLLAPIAVFGLMAKLTSQFGIETILGIGVYVLTVLAGLLALLITYATIVLAAGKMNPWQFFKNIKDVQLLAFSTSSSAAVMPLSIKTSQEKLGVKSSTAEFIIPIGATINMDGTALYQSVATIFLAQVFGVELTITSLLLLIVTVVGASIGAPATPGVGIAILALILDSIGVPLAGIAIILGVDRLLDMCRTAVNVTGDLTASVVVNKMLD